MTIAERNLWARIRMGQLGKVFYRQKPIGEYIVDFYCPRAKLAIEVDGSWHLTGSRVEYDSIRDEFLNALGLRVLRFKNDDVLRRMDKVIETIAEHMRKDQIPLNPPLRKGDAW